MTTEELNQLFDGDGWHIEEPKELIKKDLRTIKKSIEEEYERLLTGTVDRDNRNLYLLDSEEYE